MNPKKSLKLLRKVLRYHKHAYEIDGKMEKDLREMMDDVKEAFTKQIKVNPVVDHTGKRLCPSCGTWLKYRGDARNCHWCGQAIDWEGVE